MTEKPHEFTSPAELLDQALNLAYFHAEGGSPAIPFRRVDGKGKLIVIVGENASGKSFFRRIVQLMSKDNKYECMAVSAEGRRQVAYSPWLVFVYGDEEHQATGVNSMNTVLTGIKTSRSRDSKHLLFWDEPDLGLSDSWAAGGGRKMCEFLKDPPEQLVAACVVSHNKALVRELLPVEPYYLHLGTPAEEAPATLQAWLDHRPEPRDPELLPDISHERYKAIQRILDARKP